MRRGGQWAFARNARIVSPDKAQGRKRLEELISPFVYKRARPDGGAMSVHLRSVFWHITLSEEDFHYFYVLFQLSHCLC